MEETALPLLSNISNVRARHYFIHLQTDILSHTIFGTTIIFFNTPSICELGGGFCSENCSCPEKGEGKDSNYIPVINQKSDQDFFPIILECNDLNIKSVEEVKLTSSIELKQYFVPKYLKSSVEDFNYWNEKCKENLTFTQDEWSIKIKDKTREPFCAVDFPKVICILYTTKPKGDSISWRKCDNGEACFYTAGSFINNRSLFPSQDRPLAMATWQAWVMVPEDYYVSMTGDKNALIPNFVDNFEPENNTFKEKSSCYYYCTSMVLPTSTIAIAAGKWRVHALLSHREVQIYNERCLLNPSKQCKGILAGKCNHVMYPCHMKSTCIGPLVPVTLVSSSVLMPKASILLKFVKFILIASYKLMGSYPFIRLEIVIMPRCFPNLGLASPNVIYLSKALLVDDSSLYIHLAHEISHSWFGITIGPKNWEEEWLSEGFATYLEDSIYAIAVEESLREEKDEASQLSLREISEKYKNLFHLRGHIQYLTLLSENENCTEELQILSPDNPCSSQEKGAVKNGLNSEKAFLQVHYLKGYFLLHMLSKSVSRHCFDEFLGLVACRFHGQLINSIDFLDSFYEHFPNILSVLPKSKILQEWLTNPHISKDINNSFGFLLHENPLFNVVIEHNTYWIQFDKSLRKKDFNSNEDRHHLLTNFKMTYSDQIVLLFEKLLDCKKLKVRTLKHIYSFYKVQSRNSDIRHRWCELIIKHNYPSIDHISDFLTENQAMGVYLYGELIISEKERHKRLAKKIYHNLEKELDPKSKAVISSMIFG